MKADRFKNPNVLCYDRRVSVRISTHLDHNMGNAGNNISGFLEVDHLVPSSFTGYITQKWTFPNLSFLNFLKKKLVT